MGLNKSLNRHLVSNGKVQKTGSKLDLAKGVVSFYQPLPQEGGTVQSLSSFKGLHKDEYIEFSVGDKRSMAFKLSEIKSIRANAPKILTPSVDSLVIGWDGINDETSLKGERNFIVEGRGILSNLLGFEVLQFPISLFSENGSYLKTSGCPSGDCKGLIDKITNEMYKMTVKGVNRGREYQITEDIKASDLIDINVVYKCESDTPAVTKKRKFYCLEVCDTGDNFALEAIRSQYSGLKIERTSRLGAISSYKLTSKDDTAPAEYVQEVSSVISDCATCPADYTEVKGGFVYALTLLDLGLDESATVGGLPNAVATSVRKSGNGYYSVVLTKALTSEQKEAFLTDNPTATISFVGEIDKICEKNEVTRVAWKECGECEYTEEEYFIDIPDTKCGTERLEELQRAYPHLEIEVEGTKGGCKTRYKTKVATNVLCKQCDPIFMGHFTSEAPANFEGFVWKQKEAVDKKGCKVGIRVTAKPVSFHPEACIEDKFGFIEDSLELSVREVQSQETYFHQPLFTELASVTRLSSKVNRDNLGGNFKGVEAENEFFFTGDTFGKHIRRMFKNKFSQVESAKQYVDFAIEVQKEVYAQSIAKTHSHNNTYHILVEYGKHKELLAMLQELASASGVKPFSLV